MSVKPRGAAIKGWTTTATTYGALLLVGVVGRCASAAGNIVVQDGATIKFVLGGAATAPCGFMSDFPIPFTNLNVTVTASVGYSIVAVTN